MPHARAKDVLRHCAGLLLAAGMASPQALFAACSDNTPASGSDVICDGTDTTGIQAPAASDVSVTVTTGATIDTGATTAIELGPGAEIDNGGNLTTSSANTIELSASGDDTVTNSGNISSSGGLAIDFGDGDGRDTFNMNAGRVSGHIAQRGGADRFNLRGGVIDSIDQGGGQDRALIEGGRIVGTFSGGDLVTMTGGRVGTINLGTSDNEMAMQGGLVDNDILAGFQNDTLRMSGGTIDRNVDFGRGENVIELSGGSIGNHILTGSDRDSFYWSGGSIGGAVLLGDGDDSATLDSVTALGSTLLNGGRGNDSLLLRNQVITDPAQLLQWESVRLSDNSTIEFSDNLELGGTDALATRLTVDRGSSLLLIDMNSMLFTAAGQPLLLENNGTIDLRGPSENTLRIVGDYTGNGLLLLDVILGDDSSDADVLQIDGGHAHGNTQIAFNVQGGKGAATGDGILVIEALNGATTAPDAFFTTGSLSAGPYEYFLFRGTGEPSASDNWYLRSTLLPGSAAPSVRAVTPSTPNTSSIPTLPLGALPMVAAAPPAGARPIPLYRPEIPLYAQAKSLAHFLSLTEMGSYHKRRGEQRYWSSAGNNAWMRLYYQSADIDWDGDVYSRFDGNLGGIQLGGNIYSAPSCRGSQELGVFVGSSRAGGDVSGFARGFRHFDAGRNELETYYFGGYFTDYRLNRNYLDVFVKAAYLELDSRSNRGVDDRVFAPQLSVSLESGWTRTLNERISLEPQLQLVANYTNFDAYEDGISRIEPDMTPELTFRAGLRGYNPDGRNQYYAFGNLWYTLDGNDELQFDNRLYLENDRGATWAEIGAGMVLLQREGGGIYFNLSYQRSIDDLDWEAGSANLGFAWAW
ncbi:autotransporter outer membrane beta-barrel domain-containing protein [Microbulbifer marinus]|uniref:Outer membrane autotransporter barrel domain-containing protein n=1 Tax=Microbulbifer marinus TaxID=658218 RepID=A0A1H4AZW3_9GAMM|nr:autotransporter outer membrane beta-barrel domain-containing protein [Microbulbifer marinus]SEA41453.1 outer membrane autotransporter barrel domain-containing protein [Microbulbifer marinus]